MSWQPAPDYSSATGLPVYGDILTLYSLQVPAPLIETGRFYEYLRHIDRAILTSYVSFVLQKAGFRTREIRGFFAGGATDPDIEHRDWSEDVEELSRISLETPTEQLVEEVGPEDVEEGIAAAVDFKKTMFDWTLDLPWQVRYANGANALNIVFVTRAKEFETSTTEQIPARELDKDSEKSLTRLYVSLLCDKELENILLVHPAWAHQYPEGLAKMKDLEELVYGGKKLSVLACGQFVLRFIPQNERRKIIEDEWASVRNKVYLSIQEKWPIVTFATNRSLISDGMKFMSDAELDFRMGRFDDVNHHMRKAVEAVLLALYGRRTKVGMRLTPAERLSPSDLLDHNRDLIVTQYGEDVWNDLEIIIRKWGNPSSHAGSVNKPSYQDAKKVLRRGQLFMELVTATLT